MEISNERSSDVMASRPKRCQYPRSCGMSLLVGALQQDGKRADPPLRSSARIDRPCEIHCVREPRALSKQKENPWPLILCSSFEEFT